MRFSRQEYWSGWPFPSPGDLPDPGIELVSPALVGRFFTTKTLGNNVHFTTIFKKLLREKRNLPLPWSQWVMEMQSKPKVRDQAQQPHYATSYTWTTGKHPAQDALVLSSGRLGPQSCTKMSWPECPSINTSPTQAINTSPTHSTHPHGASRLLSTWSLHHHPTHPPTAKQPRKENRVRPTDPLCTWGH